MFVWECNLFDVQTISKYNDRIKYLLSVIDVFSKYFHVVLLKWNTGPSVTSAFQSFLKEAKYSKPIRRRPLWVNTDRGKEFLNKPFQGMLKSEGIQIHVCEKPDVKYSVV